jgi:4-hydroxybenzoate polyprenyltransferase
MLGIGRSCDYLSHIDPEAAKLPLYVDLDGTLIRGDTTQQASLALLRTNPLALLKAALVYGQGRAASKKVIADHMSLNAATLPYRPEVIDYIRKAKALGRRVVLATGAERRYADAVASYLSLFDAVYATENGVNLTSSNKLEIMRRDGGQAFEYLGDSHADTAIFQHTTVSGWVGVKRIRLKPETARGLHRICNEPVNRAHDVLRLIRPHQWTKNLLVVLPLLTAHKWGDTTAVWHTLLATLSLCLVASAGYVVNDALDMDADQRHPEKRRRPLANGDVTLIFAAALALILLLVGFALAAVVNAGTLALIAGYLALNLLYTIFLKRRLLIDVLALAALYSWRPVIGGQAAGVVLSEWLTTFCAFFFASLSLLKRYTELKANADAHRDVELPGRGYQPQDAVVVQTVGLMCGIAAVLVMAFYVRQPIVMELYQRPVWLWAWCPLIGYWTVRAWLLANRGSLHHDPVVFAFTDTRSYGVIVGMVLAAILAGAKGMP